MTCRTFKNDHDERLTVLRVCRRHAKSAMIMAPQLHVHRLHGTGHVPSDRMLPLVETAQIWGRYDF